MYRSEKNFNKMKLSRILMTAFIFIVFFVGKAGAVTEIDRCSVI